MNISVCMATFNGARYLRPQLDSILAQLREDDELVVVDDASEDGSLQVLRSYSDPRIRVHVNPANLGHVMSFSRALRLARHPCLVLADQDDIWAAGRLATLRAALALPGVHLATGNAEFIDAAGSPIPPQYPALAAADSTRHGRNILRIFTGKAFYYGCNMGFSDELAQLVLPIPTYVESHDLWIAMAANLIGGNLHLPDVLTYRRIHDSNVTRSDRPLWKKCRSRMVFLASLAHLWLRRAIGGAR